MTYHVHGIYNFIKITIKTVFIIPYLSIVQLLDPMHKYKMAEIVHDNLNHVFVITELFSNAYTTE